MYIFFGILYLTYLNIKDKESQEYSPFIDTFNRMTTVLIFTLLISPVLVYTFILVLKIFSNYILVVSNEDTWITFFGSTIGGVLTMLAVIFSFNLQKTNNEFDNDKTRIPRLIIELHHPIKETYKHKYYRSDVKGENPANFILELYIKNISQYPAHNLDLVYCNFEIVDAFGFLNEDGDKPIHIYKIESVHFESLNNSPIFGEYSHKILIPIRMSNKFVNNQRSEEFTYFLRTSLIYKSLFNRLSYNLETEIELSVLNLTKDIDVEVKSVDDIFGELEICSQNIKNKLNIIE